MHMTIVRISEACTIDERHNIRRAEVNVVEDITECEIYSYFHRVAGYGEHLLTVDRTLNRRQVAEIVTIAAHTNKFQRRDTNAKS